MKPDIQFFTLEEIKILSLKILMTDHFSKYFSSKQLTDKIIVDKYDISERYLFSESEYTPLQKFISKQLNHVIRWLKKKEYIQKYSNRFWVFFRDKIKEDKRLKNDR